jgi:hypothetical protein
MFLIIVISIILLLLQFLDRGDANAEPLPEKPEPDAETESIAEGNFSTLLLQADEENSIFEWQVQHRDKVLPPV